MRSAHLRKPHHLPDNHPLVAKLDGVRAAIACANPRFLGAWPSAFPRWSVGAFSGRMASVGGQQVLFLSAGEPGPGPAAALAAQMAFLCPSARLLAWAGPALANLDPARDTNALFAASTSFLNLPRVVHDPDAQSPAPNAWLAGSPGRNLQPVNEELPPATPPLEVALPLLAHAENARGLSLVHLATADDPIDSPTQRAWLAKRFPEPDRAFDRAGAAFAKAADEAGRPWSVFLAAGGTLEAAAPDFFQRHESRDARGDAAFASDLVDRLLAVVERVVA